MRRLLSSYMFVSRKLTHELLAQIAVAGFEGVEIFCSRGHFDYASKAEVRSVAQMLADNKLWLASLHAPTSRDLSATREGGTPLSICEVERVRRIEAMDELKRAIDVAEELPFPRMIFHMGGSRETADPRKRDAAFSSLEHVILHAKHLGITICVENTTSEMGDPAYLRAFVDETRLTGLRFNFDIGHAHLADGPEDERIEKSFAPLRDLVASVHLHDNHGDKDEHLPP
ncbi:MAG: sugar phosphate isomerase/epimerase family protein, partial [Candidatus Acidiferrum sp.]